MFKQINKLFFVMVTCIISGLVLVSNSQEASAYSATLTTGTDIKLNASPSGDGTSIHEESINVVSDCRAGYNLSIAAPEGSNLYTNGDDSTTAVFTAVDGTSALNSTNNTNKWGYTLTTNPTSSTVFSPLSSTQSVLKTASQTANPNANINDTFSINYGVKVDNTIVPGSYKMADSGSIVYYLTMAESCNVVDIAYDGNNADAGTMGAVGTGVIHTGVKDGDTVSLIASNFSRSGYGFAGWSLDPNAGTKLIDNDNTNNPVVYGPQEDVTLPDGFIANDTDNDNIVKLYAVWIQSQGNLQGWMGCSSLDTTTYDSSTGALDLTKNSVTALTDQRDNDTYAVARLADGNCWMIENLRLENTNSDNTTGALAQGYGTSTTYGNFSGLADLESPWADNFTAANSLYSTDGSNDTINIGTSDAVNRFPRYNHDNTHHRASSPTENTVAIYSYGNYYTWAAAIADTANYTTNNQIIAHTSLCPTGWRLPQGGSKTRIENDDDNDFWNLTVDGVNNGVNPTNYDKLTYPFYADASESGPVADKLRQYPNNFVYSGYIYSGLAALRGSFGIYWSSTVYNVNYASSLLLYSPSVYPGTYNYNKSYGQTIRCVAADPATYALTYDNNGGTGTPDSQTTTANGLASFTISTTTPTRSGYTFTGWADEKGNEVQPGGTYTTKDVNATLYAIWTNNSCNPTATTIGTGNTNTDAVCLQDVTLNMKASLPTADSTTGTYTLIDARDNQGYTVAKLADGNLWLTKNLNYGSSSDALLTSYDTDLPSGKAFKAPASTTSFETSNSYATYISPKILTDNTYGGYYSYAAAIASTDTYSTASQNITTSICPKGWDLPTSAQYNNLRTISGNTSFAAMNAAPYSFIYAGYRIGTSFTSQTSALRLWTSTNYSSSYAYYTTAYGTASYSSNYKRYGESVRCVASNGTVTINYDGNGTTEYPVTGSVASQENAEIVSANTRSGTNFIRNDWVFSGWNTAADGSGAAIAANTAISNLNPTPGSTITLYAQWLPRYTITYVNNCMIYASANTACTDSISNTTDSSQKINLTNNPSTGTETGTLAAYNKWTLTGWKIKGWSTVADNSDNSNTEYGVGKTYTVPSGSSVGSGITLYAHWAPVYSIQYDGNNADNPDGMGTTNQTTGVKSVTQTNVGEGDPVLLLAPNFKKAGYGFAGWSTDPDAWSHFTDNDNTNDSVIYGPMETISAPTYPTNGTNIITMYAVWVPAEKSDPSDPSSVPVYLQEWNSCSALTSTTFDSATGKITASKNGIIALTDKRDNEVYTIAKLADNNCWMIENLRLEHEGTVGNNTNDPTVTNESLSQGYGGTPGTYGSFVGLAASESENFGDTTAFLSFANGGIYKSSVSSPTDTYNPSTGTLEDIGTSKYPGYRFPRYNNSNNSSALSSPTFTENYANATLPSTSGTYMTSTISSYGNYYTWAAAMANTNYYTVSSTSEAAGTSICPTNWHLPSSNGTTKEYGTLSQRYGGTGGSQSGLGTGDIMNNRFRTFPNNFLYSGNFTNWSARSRGSSGLYWSRSEYNDNNACFLRLTSAYLTPSHHDNKYNGFSVRCLIGP